MKQKYRINLNRWNYVGGMQHLFSLKYYIKRNQDIRRDFKRCHHALHLMIASDRRFKTQDAILEDLKKRKESSLKKYQPKD